MGMVDDRDLSRLSQGQYYGQPPVGEQQRFDRLFPAPAGEEPTVGTDLPAEAPTMPDRLEQAAIPPPEKTEEGTIKDPYNIRLTPLYEFRKKYGERDLKRSLAAAGHAKSSYGMNVMAKFYDKLLAETEQETFQRQKEREQLLYGRRFQEEEQRYGRRQEEEAKRYGRWYQLGERGYGRQFQEEQREYGRQFEKEQQQYGRQFAEEQRDYGREIEKERPP